MQAAQPAKPISTQSHAFQIRKHDAASVTDDHVLDVSVPIDEHADLAMNLVRCFGQLTRELLGDYLPRRDAPLIEFFEAMYLICLEPLQVTFDIANSYFLRYRFC